MGYGLIMERKALFGVNRRREPGFTQHVFVVRPAFVPHR